jgi:hypothetical protein
MVAAAAGLSEIERLRQTTHTARAELKQAEVSCERAKADLRALEVTHAQEQAIAHREADAAARRAAEVAPAASFAALEARRAAEAVDEAVSVQQAAAGRVQWARAKLALLTDAAQREAVQHAIDARVYPHLPHYQPNFTYPLLTSLSAAPVEAPPISPHRGWRLMVAESGPPHYAGEAARGELNAMVKLFEGLAHDLPEASRAAKLVATAKKEADATDARTIALVRMLQGERAVAAQQALSAVTQAERELAEADQAVRLGQGSRVDQFFAHLHRGSLCV